MKEDVIKTLVKANILRKRELDLEKIKSMLKSADNNIIVVKTININEQSATLIFREVYESIRQLGEAKWWLLGYEPTNHEISLNILKELEIKDKLKLNNIERFKKIRHDANYRGFIVLKSQAEEILEFWDICCKEILDLIKKELKWE